MVAGLASKWTRRRADVLLFIVLLVAALKYTAGVDRVVDVEFYDESLYLDAGVKLAREGLNCPDCGPLFAPLYNAWYFLLSHLTHDNLSLYWLNYKLVTIIPVLLTYILLRKNNVSLLVSAVTSLVVLTAGVNLPVWPKVSHFSLMVILLFLIPASRARSISRALSLGALGAFLSSYAHPELFLTFILLLVMFVGGIAIDKEWRNRQTVAELGILAGISALTIFFLGLPVSAYRSLCAFGQHFALRWVSWTGSNVHPWVDWKPILVQNFGDVHSVFDAVRNNPGLFLRHVGQNIVDLPGNFHLMFPPNIFDDKISKIAITLIVGWALYVRRDVIRQNFVRLRVYLVIVGCFVLAGLTAVVVVYPRPHYMVVPIILVMTALALLYSSREEVREPLRWKHIAILALLMLAITPSPYIHRGTEAQRNIRAIHVIRNMHITRPVKILEAAGGIDVYLGDNFDSIDESEKQQGFREFVSARNIGMVLVTAPLATDTRFSGDPDWRDFMVHFENWGFMRVEVPRSHMEVIVRKDLLPQQ